MPTDKDTSPNKVNQIGSILNSFLGVGLTLTELRTLDEILYEQGLEIIPLERVKRRGEDYFLRSIPPDIIGLTPEESNIINIRLQDLGVTTRPIQEEDYAWKKWFYDQRIMNVQGSTAEERQKLWNKLITGLSGKPKAWIEYMDKRGVAPYTIDIPGIMDIIKIPQGPNVRYEYLKQMIERLKTARSPIPEIFKTIPKTIQTIDDAQDLLYTASVVLRFVAIKAAPKLLPGIGLALTVSDIANVSTTLLGTPLTGPQVKGRTIKTLGRLASEARYKPGEKFTQYTNRITKEATMLLPGSTLEARAREKVNLTGFILQGGQAMESVTGYGIQLGAFMAMISDSFWGTFRILGGEKVIVRPPLKIDPTYKAANYMMERLHLIQTPTELKTIDYLRLIAADLVAAETLAKEMNRDKLYKRIDDVTGKVLYTIPPQDQVIRDLLFKAGLNPDDIATVTELLKNRRTTLLEELEYTKTRIVDWLTTMHQKINNEYVSSFLTHVMDHIDKVIWTSIMGAEDTYALIPEQNFQTLFTMLEHSILPVSDTYKPTKPEIEARNQQIIKEMHKLDWQDYTVENYVRTLAQLEPRIKVSTKILDEYRSMLGAKTSPELYKLLQDETIRVWGKLELVEPTPCSEAQMKRIMIQATISALRYNRTIPNIEDIYNAAYKTGVFIIKPENLIQDISKKMIITIDPKITVIQEVEIEPISEPYKYPSKPPTPRPKAAPKPTPIPRQQETPQQPTPQTTPEPIQPPVQPIRPRGLPTIAAPGIYPNLIKAKDLE